MGTPKNPAKILVQNTKNLRDFDRELTPSELELVAAADSDEDYTSMIDPNN